MDSNHPTKRFRPPSRLPPSPAGLLLMASRLGSLSCSLASDFSDGIFDVGDTLDLSTSCQLYWCPDWPSFLYPPPGYFRSFPDPPSFSQVLPDPPRHPLRPSQIQVLPDILSDPLRSRSSQIYQLLPDPLRSSLILPDPPDPSQILPDPPRFSQILTDILSDPARSSQILPDPPRSSQILPGSPRSSQISSQTFSDPPRSSRSSPDPPRSSQISQVLPDILSDLFRSRSSQILPGPPRSPQVLPDLLRSFCSTSLQSIITIFQSQVRPSGCVVFTVLVPNPIICDTFIFPYPMGSTGASPIRVCGPHAPFFPILRPGVV